MNYEIYFSKIELSKIYGVARSKNIFKLDKDELFKAALGALTDKFVIKYGLFPESFDCKYSVDKSMHGITLKFNRDGVKTRSLS